MAFTNTFRRSNYRDLRYNKVSTRRMLIGTRLVLVLCVRSVRIVRRFFIRNQQARSIPTRSITRSFTRRLHQAFPTFRPLLCGNEIRSNKAYLCNGNLFNVLRTTINPITMIYRVNVQFLTNRNFSNRQRSAHGFVCVVRKSKPPYIALAKLSSGVHFKRYQNGRAFLSISPVSIIPVENARVIRMSFNCLLFTFPQTTILNVNRRANAMSTISQSRCARRERFANAFKKDPFFCRWFFLRRYAQYRVIKVNLVSNFQYRACDVNRWLRTKANCIT